MVYCAETDSDPISETTPAVLSIPSTVLDADYAYVVANDSLQVLLQHGKRHSVEMDATGSVITYVETGGPTPCLTNIAGGGMLFEDGPGDLDDTQVTERCSERWKEDNVARNMLTRCAEDAAEPPPNERLSPLKCCKMLETDRTVKVVSDSVISKITNLDQVRARWMIF